jgi:hypothetical protein
MNSLIPQKPRAKEVFDEGYVAGFYHGYTAGTNYERYEPAFNRGYGVPAPSQGGEHTGTAKVTWPQRMGANGVFLFLFILCVSWFVYNRVHGEQEEQVKNPAEQKYYSNTALGGFMEVDEAGYPKHGGLLHFMPKDIREAAERGDGNAVLRYDAALLRGLGQDLAVKESLAPSPQLRELRHEVNKAAGSGR